MVSPETLAYLAGFVDGEGCIGIRIGVRKNGHRWAGGYVSLVNTDPTVPVLMQRLFGGSLRGREPAMLRHKLRWEWEMGGAGACRVVEFLYPYLQQKRLQAENLLDFEEWRRGRYAVLHCLPSGLQAFRRQDHEEMLTYAQRARELNAGREAS